MAMGAEERLCVELGADRSGKDGQCRRGRSEDSDHHGTYPLELARVYEAASSAIRRTAGAGWLVWDETRRGAEPAMGGHTPKA